MRILLVTDVIHAGGAETFVLRLAQALFERGHQVIVYPLYKTKIDYSIISSLAPNVHIVPARIRQLRAIQKVDGLLRKLKIDLSVLNHLLAHDLALVIKQNGIQVVHSHLFTSDIVAVIAGKKTAVPVITTIHGDYSAYDLQSRSGKLKRILNFQNKMALVLSQMKSIVCICEAQLKFFKQYALLFKSELPTTKIYNGFARPVIAESARISRQELGIPQHAFVFCMVARGIPEKGWEEVLLAFRQLQSPNCFLLLIGGSAYVESLKSRHASPGIFFLGKQDQPFRYLQVVDAGLFCSKITTEALPTVIIEYLAAGIPVISTDVGEADLMLKGKDGSAGKLVSFESSVFVGEVKDAMLHFVEDKESYSLMKRQTASAFAKFDMDKCVNDYMRVYSRPVSHSTSGIQESLTQ